MYNDLTTIDFHIYEGNISYSKDGWFNYVRETSACIILPCYYRFYGCT